MVLDQIFLSLNMDAEGVKKGINNAEDYIKTGMSSIVSFLAPLAGGAIFATAFSSFTEGAKEAGKYADLLGMSVEDLQAWQGAAEAMGAEGEEINEMLIDMNEYLVDMVQYGSGPAVDILKSLGIAATDATGNIRPAVDVLLDMAEAGEKVSKQEMLAYGKIMGFDKSVIDLLMMGKKGLQELLKTQAELAVYNEDDVKLTKEWNLHKQAFMKALSGVSAIIMRAVMPAVNLMTEGVSKFVLFLRKNEGFTKAFFGTLGVLATALAIKMTIAFAPIILIFAAIGAAVAAVALIVDDFFTYLEGGDSALAPLWENFENFFNFIGNAFEHFIEMWKGVGQFLSALFQGEWDKAGDALYKVFENSIGMILNLFVGLFAFVFDGIKGIFTGIAKAADFIFGDDDDEGDEKAKARKSGALSFLGTSGEQIMALQKQGISNEQARSTNVANTHTTNTQNIQNTNSTNVGQVVIKTNATDANGIAKNIGPALKNEARHNVMASSSGVVAK